MILKISLSVGKIHKDTKNGVFSPPLRVTFGILQPIEYGYSVQTRDFTPWKAPTLSTHYAKNQNTEE